MTETILSSLVALATAQAWLYRVDSKEAIRSIGFHTLFYFFLSVAVEGLSVFCSLFAIQFYELPLFCLAMFFIFGRPVQGFPAFANSVPAVPHFYLFTSLWFGLMWMANGPETANPLHFAHGYYACLLAAVFLPVFSALRERLTLLETPPPFRGLPIFMIASGIFLIGLLSFVR